VVDREECQPAACQEVGRDSSPQLPTQRPIGRPLRPMHDAARIAQLAASYRE
jgi:hypothetical protein